MCILVHPHALAGEWDAEFLSIVLLPYSVENSVVWPRCPYGEWCQV